MGRNSVISREARQYIVQQVQENGIVTVADVANIVRRYYQFDPQKSFNHDVEQYSRRILANQKDNNGNRTLIAVKGEPGVYIDLDHCKDLLRLRKAVEQLTDRVTGLEKNITKGRFDSSCQNNDPLPGNARYCPFCGAESTFFQKGILPHWNENSEEIDNDGELPF